MKKRVAALIVGAFLMVGCDGSDGINGLTGPSGVDELATTTCETGKVIQAVAAADSGVVTITCVDA